MIDKIAVADIPEETKKLIGKDIFDYSCGLIGLSSNDKAEGIALLGSGSLVEMGGLRGILTAAHVVRQPKWDDSELIGLALDASVSRFTLPKSKLSDPFKIGGSNGKKGPDIAFIPLDAATVQSIAAIKSFWNLDKYSDKFSTESECRIKGLWVLFGCLGELFLDSESKPGFLHTKSVGAMFGFSSTSTYQIIDDHDYLELDVVYSQNEDIPKTFGGCSGGGRWSVSLFDAGEGKIDVSRAMLGGVAFFETGIEKYSQKIICHGFHSVYETLRKTYQSR